MAKRREFHPALVPALDTLIGNPDILAPEPDTKLKAETLYVPMQYIDRVREFRHEQSSRGEAATKLLGIFSRILETTHYADNGHKDYVCKNSMKIQFVPSSEIDITDVSTSGRTGANTHALATAKYVQKKLKDPSQVAIMTGDNYMSSKALAQDIDVARINPDVYTGRRKLVLPPELYDSWFKHRQITTDQLIEFFSDEEPLHYNEFVEFEVDPIAASTYGVHNLSNPALVIGRYEPQKGEDTGILRQLHYIDELPRCIQPRSAGQAMFAEALMAPADELPIVICPAVFGTGKTYLATSIGIHFVTNRDSHYERIFVVPRDAELGKEIGFLPGDEREKTLAKAMPIVDNVREYIKCKGDRKKGNTELTAQEISKRVESMIEDNFEFVSIINMGGRSISDCWIIYDEAQDMERFQINQLMKRIGDGSKMIITGDPNQVFNKHMDYHSNGLMYAATKMAGSPFAAVVTMTEDEITRSEAAREIARLLDH